MILNNRARLLISCPDRPGIVAAVSQCLFEQGANIVHSDQHTTDPEGGVFFMRIEFDLPELDSRGVELERAFEPIARQFRMEWRLAYAARIKPIAIFVSKEDHCLLELLWRWKAGDMAAEIAMVVSNHTDLRRLVEAYGIPFHHIAVTRERQEQAETAQLQLIEGKVDLIVMARYMRILSSAFIRRFPNRIINIHHSFLPAFVGADPYAQAHSRGVKLIGATAHYATDALDAGPIIEQDVERVDHRHTVEDLKRIGRHVERVVLARAVTWHLEDKVLVYGNKTVVFA
ncbi:MAG TPA: formyltetrahydrofolate deformylase [Patescibacteria group bacterium]|nr:formyltetrahydrofolate deformylase [Patescibacteria group bacterium]